MKKSIRKQYKELRKQLSMPEVKAKSAKILDFLLETQLYQNAKTIFVYCSFGHEVKTQDLIAQALADGKTVALPYIGSDNQMKAYQISALSDLGKDYYDIPAPNPQKDRLIAADQFDLAIVPLLAFNSQGHRMGYGKGFYDYYLPNLSAHAKTIGLAYSLQYCEDLPLDLYDYPLQNILTENGFFPLTMRVEIHCHSPYSVDCQRNFAQLLAEAEKKNLQYLTLTDHFDQDWQDGMIIPNSAKQNINRGEWTFSISDYFDNYLEKQKLQSEKSDQPQLLIGIELGYVDYLVEEYNQIIQQYPFDCIISSIHAVARKDFSVLRDSLYGVSKSKAYQTYLQTMLEMLKSDLNFNIMGHFDYVTRYAPYDDPNLYYRDYPELFDQIFKDMIAKNISLEVNTRTRYQDILSGKKDQDIVDLEIYQRYYELGGRMISFATDAHQTGNLYALISDSIQELKKIGFTHGTYFINQQPHFYEL